jgi:hypothetical protein
MDNNDQNPEQKARDQINRQLVADVQGKAKGKIRVGPGQLFEATRKVYENQLVFNLGPAILMPRTSV